MIFNMTGSAGTGDELRVYLGRFSPMHIGHQRVIHEAQAGIPPENFLLVLGSANAPRSWRHIFSLSDRTRFIRTCDPDLNLTSLADQDDWDEWFFALEQTLASWRYGRPPGRVTFCAGSRDDVPWLYKRGLAVRIFNRFDGSGPGQDVSASKVRDALMEGRSIRGLVDDRIADDVTDTFRTHWKALREK